MTLRSAKAERIFWYDLLRLAAIFAVVCSHLSGYAFDDAAGMSAGMAVVRAVYSAAADFCVPALVMISGAMLLRGDRPLSIRRLYLRKILRLVTALAFWLCAYALVAAAREHGASSPAFWPAVLDRLVHEHFHLWYMYMIIGLYAISPLLRAICERESTRRYFLLLWLALGVVPATIHTFCPWLDVRLEAWRLDMWGNDKLSLGMVTGYAGYMVLGLQLSRRPPGRRARRALYALAACMQLLSVLSILWMTYSQPDPHRFVLSAQNPCALNNAIYTAAVFTFFQHCFAASPRSALVRRGVTVAAQLSFGVYLMHDFANLLVSTSPALSALVAAFPPVTLPLVAVGEFLLSMAAVALLALLPGSQFILGEAALALRRPARPGRAKKYAPSLSLTARADRLEEYQWRFPAGGA